MRNGVMMIGETGRGGRGGEMAGVGRGVAREVVGLARWAPTQKKQRTGAQKQKARLARVQGEEGAAPKGTEAYSVQRLSAMGLSRFARLDRRTKEANENRDNALHAWMYRREREDEAMKAWWQQWSWWQQPVVVGGQFFKQHCKLNIFITQLHFHLVAWPSPMHQGPDHVPSASAKKKGSHKASTSSSYGSPSSTSNSSCTSGPWPKAKAKKKQDPALAQVLGSSEALEKGTATSEALKKGTPKRKALKKGNPKSDALNKGNPPQKPKAKTRKAKALNMSNALKKGTPEDSGDLPASSSRVPCQGL